MKHRSSYNRVVDPSGPRTSRLRWIWLLGLALLAIATMGCITAPPLPTPTYDGVTVAVAPQWRRSGLRPGDLVVVDVFGHREFSTPDAGTRVDLEGNLAIPFLGATDVVGRTVEETRADLVERLRPYLKEPVVSVSIQDLAPRSFYVVGEVERPGRYQLDAPINAFQGLAFGGTLRPGADRDQAVLLRAHGGQLETHLFGIDTPTEAALVSVEPDDILYIRRSGAGAFLQETLPYLQASAFATGSVANLVFTLNALDGN